MSRRLRDHVVNARPAAPTPVSSSADGVKAAIILLTGTVSQAVAEQATARRGRHPCGAWGGGQLRHVRYRCEQCIAVVLLVQGGARTGGDWGDPKTGGIRLAITTAIPETTRLENTESNRHRGWKSSRKTM
eukprot:15468565-Alexandrium_andersonii.AAC.1